MIKPFPNGSISWVQRYEAVRQHVLGGREILTVPPLGLVVLLQHGVAGWMRRWTDEVVDKVVPAVTAPLGLPTPEWQHQLTLLLAQMTLGYLRDRSHL